MSDLISKEQAIKAMQDSEFGYTFEVDVAIGAVKALPTVEPEQKKGEWDEDLISRKEMIRAVDSNGEDYISYWKLLLLIGRMPSAEPKQTAKVIIHKRYIGTNLNIVGTLSILCEHLCGACKKKVIDGDNYCSHCGARLEWNE